MAEEDKMMEWFEKRSVFMEKYKSLQGGIQLRENPRVTTIVDDYCDGKYTEVEAVNTIIATLTQELVFLQDSSMDNSLRRITELVDIKFVPKPDYKDYFETIERVTQDSLQGWNMLDQDIRELIREPSKLVQLMEAALELKVNRGIVRAILTPLKPLRKYGEIEKPYQALAQYLQDTRK